MEGFKRFAGILTPDQLIGADFDGNSDAACLDDVQSVSERLLARPDAIDWLPKIDLMHHQTLSVSRSSRSFKLALREQIVQAQDKAA